MPSGRNRFSRPLDDRPPKVIGHRGAAGHAPENTLVAIRKAAALGARWVEFDVKLSGDDVPVLFHDDTLERTTSGRGPIAQCAAAGLANLDAGAWFGRAFAGEPVPTLDAAMAELAALAIGANVEIKPSMGRETETGQAVGKALAAGWPGNLPAPLISSFSPIALAAAAAAAPDIPRALLVFGVPRDWRRQLEDLQCAALHCLSRKLREGRARDIITAGYTLRCFTVNRPRRARQLLGWGVDGIISDFPDRLLPLL